MRLVLAALLFAGCARASKPELERLYAEDQIDQKRRELKPEELSERQAERLARVLALHRTGRVRTPEEKFLAASVLQHGHTSDHYLLGHELAASAALSGFDEARWLAAANQDRYRMSIGKPQWYGTQLSIDEETGKWRVYPVEPVVTDEERERWNVRPLAQSRAIADRLNKEGLARFENSVDERRGRAIEREYELRKSSTASPSQKTVPSGS